MSFGRGYIFTDFIQEKQKGIITGMAECFVGRSSFCCGFCYLFFVAFTNDKAAKE